MAAASLYAPICPHDSIEEIFSDIYMVRGSIQLNPFVRISRNMAVIRHESELTLIDPIRLDEKNEEQLCTLGEIKRILRLGPFHGADDRYYVDRFETELWAPGLSEAYPDPAPDRIIDPDTPLPLPDARLFRFEGTMQPECALLIERDGGLLLTCDAIQHYGDNRHNNWLARIMMPFIGFPKTTVIGPIWLKLMTPEGASLESEFRRLAGWRFAHLLSAHGSLLRDDAHASVERAIDRAFPRRKS
jgi:hypothetical protein